MTDQLVEAIGLYIQDRQGDYAQKDICATVGELGEGLLEALKANGFAVVPVEPTEGMMEAAWLCTGESHAMRPRTELRMAKYYRAMIAAAGEGV